MPDILYKPWRHLYPAVPEHAIACELDIITDNIQFTLRYKHTVKDLSICCGFTPIVMDYFIVL